MVSRSRSASLDLSAWPCARDGFISPMESHPCYYCGFPIPLGTNQCEECSLMICPKCDGCFCTSSDVEKIALIVIHFTYCRVLERLQDFEDFGSELDFAPSEFKEHCREALLYCGKCVKELQSDPIIKS